MGNYQIILKRGAPEDGNQIKKEAGMLFTPLLSLNLPQFYQSGQQTVLQLTYFKVTVRGYIT